MDSAEDESGSIDTSLTLKFRQFEDKCRFMYYLSKSEVRNINEIFECEQHREAPILCTSNKSQYACNLMNFKSGENDLNDQQIVSRFVEHVVGLEFGKELSLNVQDSDLKYQLAKNHKMISRSEFLVLWIALPPEEKIQILLNWPDGFPYNICLNLLSVESLLESPVQPLINEKILQETLNRTVQKLVEANSSNHAIQVYTQVLQVGRQDAKVARHRQECEDFAQRLERVILEQTKDMLNKSDMDFSQAFNPRTPNSTLGKNFVSLVSEKDHNKDKKIKKKQGSFFDKLKRQRKQPQFHLRKSSNHSENIIDSDLKTGQFNGRNQITYANRNDLPETIDPGVTPNFESHRPLLINSSNNQRPNYVQQNPTGNARYYENAGDAERENFKNSK